MGNLFNDDLPFDSDPTEDDAIDLVDPAKEEKNTEINNNKPNNFMSNTNWSTPTYTSPWAGPTQQVNNSNPSPYPFGSTNTIFNNSTPSFINSTPFGSTNINNSKSESLPRSKKIIFCDFMDNIVENYQGCPGIAPRGIYDIRPKYDFWWKMKHINPDYIIVCTNQNFAPGSKQERDFKKTIDYYLAGLTDFTDLDENHCFSLCKIGFDKDDPRVKPNPGLIIDALKFINWKQKGYKKSDILIVGYNSGYPGQSDKDYRMAKRLGIDYIDIPQLISQYV